MLKSSYKVTRNLCSFYNNLKVNHIRWKIDFKVLNNVSKVPQEPLKSSDLLQNNEYLDIEIDEKTIQLLERLSLVDLDSIEALNTLKDSIRFASKILKIDTNGIAPLYSVLEKEILRLRNDEVTDGNIREKILQNAKIVEEEYFVAPPGNIPLEQEKLKNKI